MTPTQIELVQSSWKRVAATDADTAGAVLYQQLLAIVPELVTSIAARPVKEPSRRVLFVMSYMIRKLHHPDAVLNEVKCLTRQHLTYNMRDDQYIQTGRLLLQVLSKGLKENWNNETA